MDFATKLEIGQASYDAFNRRDIEALLELYDPDCEWLLTNFEGWPEKPVYRGHEGLVEFFHTWLDPWEEFHVEIKEAFDLSGDRTFGVAYNRGRGRLSGALVELPPIGQIVSYRSDRVLRVDNYSDLDQASRAAGLSEYQPRGG